MDEFVFKSGIKKIYTAKPLKYVSFHKKDGSFNEYVFIEYRGLAVCVFLSSLILVQDKDIDEQFKYINDAIDMSITYMDMYFFQDIKFQMIKQASLDFISTKIFMDLNLVKAVDNKLNLIEYDYKTICIELEKLVKSGMSLFNSYIFMLKKYNFSTLNILGIEFDNGFDLSKLPTF